MSDLFQSFISVFSELTWKRFFGIFLLAILASLVFLIFERYTSSFSLARIQKTADVLEKLHQLEINGVAASPSLKESYDSLIQQTNDVVSTKPFSLTLGFPEFSMYSLAKFFAAFWPWSLFLILAIKEKQANRRTGYIAAFFIFGLMAGGLGLFMRNQYWMNLIFYPLVFFILVIFLVIGFGFYLNKKQRFKNKQGNAANA
jgi:hypothetical protein